MKYTHAQQQLLQQMGRRIRLARQSKGLSQESLALEAGIDRTYLSSVELGRRNIAVINLYKIASVLQIHVSELLP